MVLAGVDPAGGDRSGRDPPGLVGGHDLTAAVRVRDHQLPRHGGLIGVEGCGLTAEAVPLGGPAAGETDPERVGPGHEQRGHVGGLVDEPPLVRGPARLEHLVVDVGAVDAGLVDAESGRVEHGGLDVPGDLELGPGQSGLRSCGGLGQADRRGDPLPLGQETGADPQRFAPGGGGSVVSGNPDAEPDVIPGRQRGERPVDQHGSTALDGSGLGARGRGELELGAPLRPGGDVGRGSPGQPRLGHCNLIETTGGLCTHPLDDEVVRNGNGGAGGRHVRAPSLV